MVDCFWLSNCVTLLSTVPRLSVKERCEKTCQITTSCQVTSLTPRGRIFLDQQTKKQWLQQCHRGFPACHAGYSPHTNHGSLRTCTGKAEVRENKSYCWAKQIAGEYKIYFAFRALSVRTVKKTYPTVLNAPAHEPISRAPHGWMTMLEAVPTATPPARVAFCMWTWGEFR